MVDSPKVLKHDIIGGTFGVILLLQSIFSFVSSFKIVQNAKL